MAFTVLMRIEGIPVLNLAWLRLWEEKGPQYRSGAGTQMDISAWEHIRHPASGYWEYPTGETDKRLAFNIAAARLAGEPELKAKKYSVFPLDEDSIWVPYPDRHVIIWSLMNSAEGSVVIDAPYKTVETIYPLKAELVVRAMFQE